MFGLTFFQLLITAFIPIGIAGLVVLLARYLTKIQEVG